jgi:hypothetical protein
MHEENQVIRLVEIVIDPAQSLLDTISSGNAYDAVVFHDRVKSTTGDFKLNPLAVYTEMEITNLLETAISLRALVAEEFSSHSQPYRALSHVIFYSQTHNK